MKGKVTIGSSGRPSRAVSKPREVQRQKAGKTFATGLSQRPVSVRSRSVTPRTDVRPSPDGPTQMNGGPNCYCPSRIFPCARRELLQPDLPKTGARILEDFDLVGIERVFYPVVHLSGNAVYLVPHPYGQRERGAYSNLVRDEEVVLPVPDAYRRISDQRLRLVEPCRSACGNKVRAEEERYAALPERRRQ